MHIQNTTSDLSTQMATLKSMARDLDYEVNGVNYKETPLPKIRTDIMEQVNLIDETLKQAREEIAPLVGCWVREQERVRVNKHRMDIVKGISLVLGTLGTVLFLWHTYITTH